MKHKLLLTTLVVLLGAKFSLYAQVDQAKLGDAAGTLTNEMSNSIKELGAERLSSLRSSLLKLQEAMKSLDAGKIDDALIKADAAREAFPKYALPYLVMSFSYIKKNDFLSSNRALYLYDEYKSKGYNKKLIESLPPGFVDLVRNKNDEGFQKLSKAELAQTIAKEPWLNQTLEISLIPTVMSTGDGDLPSFISDNTVGLNYKKFFWFNKDEGSYYTNNNFGATITAGVDFNFTSAGDQLPANYKFYVTPGFYLKKVHISPFQIRYHALTKYTGAVDPENSEVSNFGLVVSPEIKWYVGAINANAADMRKLSAKEKADSKFTFAYLLFKFQYDEYAGAQATEEFSVKKFDLLGGFGGYVGKNRTAEFCLLLGAGNINTTTFSGKTTGGATTDVFKLGFRFAKRIF
jgi:hypothetical protein